MLRPAYISSTIALSILLAACSSSGVAPSAISRSAAVSPDDGLAQLELRPLRMPAYPAGLCLTSAGKSADDFSPFGTGFAPGNGPVYPVLGSYQPNTQDGSLSVGVPDKVLWIANPRYSGPILLRGERLGGTESVHFGTSQTAVTSLQLTSGTAASAQGTPVGTSSAGWRNWPSYTFLTEPGCYAYQVDGIGLSETIVFRASYGPLGMTGCQPPSPVHSGDGVPAAAEVEGTSSTAELWALLFTSPIHAGVEVKIVWHMTGTGALSVATVGPGRISARMTAGPQEHGGSNWDRPGDEWRTAFVFQVAGCWDVHAKRGGAAGDVWLVVP
jgi:hypothetical protein